jgi:hypothetical protein
MSYPVSIDVIKEELAKRVDDIVETYFPNAVKEGREWKLGSIKGEPGSSLSICRYGSRAGWWKDFGGDDKGDVLDLFAAAKGVELREAISKALEWLNLGGLNDADRRRAEAAAARSRAVKEHDDEQKLAELRRAAKRRYLEADKLYGSTAWEYLRHRGLHIPPPGTRAEGGFNALRSHPGLKDPFGTVRPALVASIQRLHGGQISLHRVFLERLASGVVVKAPIVKPKRAYCEYRGGFIAINRGVSGKPIAEAPEGEWIAAAEGPEDSIAIALAAPEQRVVCAVSLSNFGSLDLPRHIGGLYLHRHRGDPPDAVAAFGRQVDRLRQRGLGHDQIRELWAPDGFKDFTEVFEAAQRQRERAAFEATDPLTGEVRQ